MPTRNYSFQASEASLELFNLKVASSIFDEEFSVDMDMKDWNDWMQNESNMLQLESPVKDRRNSTASTVSWVEHTCSIETAGKDAIFPSFLNNNDFSFEDALLDFDEVPQFLGLPMTNSNESSSSSNAINTPRNAHTFRNFSLTEEEERNLTAIAMPSHVLAAQAHSEEATSPAHSDFSPAPSASPEPPVRGRKNKKRKSSLDDIEALCQSRKTGHNAIEKRYRTNLNEKIDCLRLSMPPFPHASTISSNSTNSRLGSVDVIGEGDGEDMEEYPKIDQQKYGKAAILTRALDYIKHLEDTSQRLGGEVSVLKNRVGAFEKLAMSGSIALSDRVGLVASGMWEGVKSETLESIRAGVYSSSYLPDESRS